MIMKMKCFPYHGTSWCLHPDLFEVVQSEHSGSNPLRCTFAKTLSQLGIHSSKSDSYYKGSSLDQ